MRVGELYVSDNTGTSNEQRGFEKIEFSGAPIDSDSETHVARLANFRIATRPTRSHEQSFNSVRYSLRRLLSPT